MRWWPKRESAAVRWWREQRRSSVPAPAVAPPARDPWDELRPGAISFLMPGDHVSDGDDERDAAATARAAVLQGYERRGPSRLGDAELADWLDGPVYDTYPESVARRATIIAQLPPWRQRLFLVPADPVIAECVNTLATEIARRRLERINDSA